MESANSTLSPGTQRFDQARAKQQIVNPKKTSTFEKFVKPKAEPAPTSYGGPSRRIVSLIPRPQKPISPWEGGAQVEKTPIQKLLLDIESNQLTCCVNLSSPRYKSRSAALVLRGRAIACVYGKKGFSQQLFGDQAYEFMLSEISEKGNYLEAFMLEEQFLLANAAMFTGSLIDLPNTNSARQNYEAAQEIITNTRRPGAIVITDEKGLSLCAVDLFQGKMIGCYSYETASWLVPHFHSVEPFLARATNAACVSAAMLDADSLDEVLTNSWSLSGLADRPTEEWQTAQKVDLPISDVSNVMLIRYARNKQKPMRPAIEVNRFITRFRPPAPDLNRPIVIANPYKINTLSTY
jgi:hypothetical protein